MPRVLRRYTRYRSHDIISRKFDCDILQAKRYNINSFITCHRHISHRRYIAYEVHIANSAGIYIAEKTTDSYKSFVFSIAFDYIIDATKYLVDMQTSFARYFYFRKIDMFSLCSNSIWYKSRCRKATYRVRQHISSLQDISNISGEIYIDEKTTCRNKSFFLVTPTGFEPMLSPWKGGVLPTWPRGLA